MTLVLFFLFAALAVGAAVMVVAHRNPIYSALFLIITLFALAGLYVLLQAPFIAAIHVIVYAGAIMVLFLFVVMLLELDKQSAARKKSKIFTGISLVAAGILVVELAIFITAGEFDSAPATALEPVAAGDTQSIGLLLFTKYLFPFEVASVLLLSAIIGAVVLAKLKLRT